jgi:hypothetical protein
MILIRFYLKTIEMSYKNDLLTKLNTLAFFKKCRACEEGLGEVWKAHFLKI